MISIKWSKTLKDLVRGFFFFYNITFKIKIKFKYFKPLFQIAWGKKRLCSSHFLSNLYLNNFMQIFQYMLPAIKKKKKNGLLFLSIWRT